MFYFSPLHFKVVCQACGKKYITVLCNVQLLRDEIGIYTGKCLKPEQFLKAEHLLKHAFPYRDRSFYGPDRLRQLIYP